jgi:hypothetical protein
VGCGAVVEAWRRARKAGQFRYRPEPCSRYRGSMPDMEFKDKFIGFVDILGFKKLVEAAEQGSVTNLNEVRGVLKEFGSPDKRERLGKSGSQICPHSKSVQRDLDFRVTQVSDSVLVSCEISPVGAINVIEHCWSILFCLLQKGAMCRGYITRGRISHEADCDFVGTGAQKALANEKVVAFKQAASERGTPFVEIDPNVSEYVNNCGDECVKKMFSRCVSSDGESVALFPFQRLAHRFLIEWRGQYFDPDKESQSNENVRLNLANLKERVMALVDMSNPSAVTKAEHYTEALNAQLAICDKTDEFIAQFRSTLPPR